MQNLPAFRVLKTPRKTKSSKPRTPLRVRVSQTADLLESDLDNLAMVACSNCTNEGVLCYYDREQSVSCSECLRRRRKCDGTFSTEEYRDVDRLQKEQEQEALLAKEEVLRLNAALAAVHRKLSSLKQEAILLRDEKGQMLRKELINLGVMNHDGSANPAWYG